VDHGLDRGVHRWIKDFDQSKMFAVSEFLLPLVFREPLFVDSFKLVPGRSMTA
jgi:hypothetical protein